MTDGYRDELDVEVGPRKHSVVLRNVEAPPAFARVRDALWRAANP
jgi:hypothetical protein